MPRRLAGIAVSAAAASAVWFASGCSDSLDGTYRDYTAVDAEKDEAAERSERPTAESSADADRTGRLDDAASEVVEAPSLAGPSGSACDDIEPEPTPGEITPVAATLTPSSLVRTVPVDPADAATGAPRELKVLVPERTFRAEGADGTLRVSYDDLDLLKVLNAEPVPADVADHMPQWLKELDGKRIRVRGWMYPPFSETGIRNFVLARDNQICCFGRNPKPYDLIEVFMRKGESTDYIQNRPFDVVGVFHIVPQTAGGLMYRLYEIEDAVVIDR